MPDRKKAQAFILNFVKEIEPTGYNYDKYSKDILPNMTDKQFDTYMKGLRDGSMTLVLFKPLYKAAGITVENNVALGKKYGLNFFERLVYTGNPDLPDHKTGIEYMVLDLPYRKQSQTLVKKVSVPDNNKTVDQLTYQPTGASKGSKISYPELQVLIGMGMDNTIEELIQFRGGDRGGFRAYNAMVMRYGSANLTSLKPYKTGVDSTKALKIYLTCMHVTNTF